MYPPSAIPVQCTRVTRYSGCMDVWSRGVSPNDLSTPSFRALGASSARSQIRCILHTSSPQSPYWHPGSRSFIASDITYHITSLLSYFFFFTRHAFPRSVFRRPSRKRKKTSSFSAYVLFPVPGDDATHESDRPSERPIDPSWTGNWAEVTDRALPG